MIEIAELQYTRADLTKAPERERTYFLMATGLANDLQTLVKSFAIALADDDDRLIIRQGGSAVAMLFLRLTAGRLWEGRTLLDASQGSVASAYAPEVGPEAGEALRFLREYYADRRNLVATVRDKIGFHADRGIVRRAFERLPDDADMGEYMCSTMGNTLFYSAEMLHYEAINGFTGLNDQIASLHHLVGEVHSVVNRFNTFIYGFVIAFARRHLSAQLDQLPENKSIIADIPSLENLRLPYFSQLPAEAGNRR